MQKVLNWMCVCVCVCVCVVFHCFPLQLLHICQDSFLLSWFQKCEAFSSRQSRHSVCFFTLWRPVFSWVTPAVRERQWKRRQWVHMKMWLKHRHGRLYYSPRSPPSSLGRGRLSLHPEKPEQLFSFNLNDWFVEMTSQKWHPASAVFVF